MMLNKKESKIQRAGRSWKKKRKNVPENGKWKN